jgi:hypothetical protein
MQFIVICDILAEHLLSPMEGTHRNLSTDSLTGWKECYRSTYAKPFNQSVLDTTCRGSRLLVACRSLAQRTTLTLAAVGRREDVLYPCLPKQCRWRKKNNRTTLSSCSTQHQCMTQAKRGVGWYYVANQTWGFVRGSLSFVVNPCDSSQLDADYRLCWTMLTSGNHSHSDRCGSMKNLHKSNQWERIIYTID